MVQCINSGKDVSEDSVVYCDMCGAPLCEECGNLGLCSTCTELWEAEIDLEDMEAEEDVKAGKVRGNDEFVEELRKSGEI